MLRYYKLFDLLNRRGMKKTDLLEVVSPPTLAKMGKGKNIQTEAIDKICRFLKCQPGDIMEYITYEEELTEDTALIKDENNETKLATKLTDNELIELEIVEQLSENEPLGIEDLSEAEIEMLEKLDEEELEIEEISNTKK